MPHAMTAAPPTPSPAAQKGAAGGGTTAAQPAGGIKERQMGGAGEGGRQPEKVHGQADAANLGASSMPVPKEPSTEKLPAHTQGCAPARQLLACERTTWACRVG
jgi:hypothetical protein